MKLVFGLVLVLLCGVSYAYATNFASLHLDDNIPEIIKENNTILFSGQLTTPQGVAIAHRPIFIEDDRSYMHSDEILGIVETDDNGKFSMTWKAIPKNNNNPYHFYALFLGGKTFGFTRSEVYESQIVLLHPTKNPTRMSITPDWFKPSSKMWYDGQIRDVDFAHIITNLVEKGIIQKPDQDTANMVIPVWVKNSANLFAEDQISEGEFLNSIQYLINNGIIQV